MEENRKIILDFMSNEKYVPMKAKERELSAEEKNSVSHRANALKLLYEKLREEREYADK